MSGDGDPAGGLPLGVLQPVSLVQPLLYLLVVEGLLFFLGAVGGTDQRGESLGLGIGKHDPKVVHGLLGHGLSVIQRDQGDGIPLRKGVLGVYQ